MQTNAYERLVAHLKRVHYLGTVAGLLGWDEQVNLPPDSADQRAEQLALLAELQHAAATDPEIGSLLAELTSAAGSISADCPTRSTSASGVTGETTAPAASPLAQGQTNTTGCFGSELDDQKVVVREARRDYERVVKLPAAFVAEKARHASAAYHAWAAAKQADDFSSFAPFLEKHLDLARQEAAFLGWDERPYDYAIDKHDPGLTAAKLTTLFTELKVGLVPLVRAIAASPVRPPAGVLKKFPVEAQRDFLREVTEKLGFNYRRGRIDVSLHPFCEGAGADIRMTTRFDADNPLDSLFSSIHETGHGLYEQGLPLSAQGTPLGQNAGMGVHESQSRLWENQVSRSRAFWRFFEPRFRDKFPAQLAAVSSDELYLAVNEVAPTLIRVDSDEVHYNLHILLRFELERRLFAGELAVADLPAAWNALSQELLGLTPASDRTGVLQDVHWSGGAFGYFPSYCLGNMIAAQLWFTVRSQYPELDADFAAGDFSRLLGWLRTQIHEQGRRYEALELVRRVTGEELTPKHLLRYLHERYAPLYLGLAPVAGMGGAALV